MKKDNDEIHREMQLFPAYCAVRDPEGSKKTLIAITAMPDYAGLSLEELRYEQRERGFPRSEHELERLALRGLAQPTVCVDSTDYGRLLHCITAKPGFTSVSLEELRYLHCDPATAALIYTPDSSPRPSPARPRGTHGANRNGKKLACAEVGFPWRFLTSITAVDAFADRSFEEFRLEDRNAPMHWAPSLTARRTISLLTLMELRIREVVGRVVERDRQWWKRFQETPRANRLAQWIQPHTTSWLQLTLQETIQSWYPEHHHWFRVMLQDLLRVAVGVGQLENVPASLNWIDRGQVFPRGQHKMPSPVSDGEEEKDLMDELDPFAFVGFYCAQAHFLKLLDETDPKEWTSMVNRQSIYDSVKAVSVSLSPVLVGRLENVTGEHEIAEAVAEILHVNEHRQHQLQALLTKSEEIRRYIQACEQYALTMLEYWSEEEQAREEQDRHDAVRASVVDAVFIQDDIGADQLRNVLTRLENKAIPGQDWFPVRSGKTCCFVNTMRPMITLDKVYRIPCFTSGPLAWLDPYGQMSEIAFQDGIPTELPTGSPWLPSELMVNSDGKVRFASYITNLHPNTCQELYQQLERILTSLIPSFDRAMWALTQCAVTYPPPWLTTPFPVQPYVLGCLSPRPQPGEYVPSLYSSPQLWSLRGSRQKVLIRIEEIEISNSGHVHEWDSSISDDGNIAAVGLVCYGMENVRQAFLAFQCVVSCDPSRFIHLAPDSLSYKAFSGFDFPTSSLERRPQNCGSVQIHERGSCVWPNVYRTHFEEVQLEDENKSGVLKLVCFYLMRPDASMLSTAEVPPEPVWSTTSTDELANKFGLPEIVIDRILRFCRPSIKPTTQLDTGSLEHFIEDN